MKVRKGQTSSLRQIRYKLMQPGVDYSSTFSITSYFKVQADTSFHISGA